MQHYVQLCGKATKEEPAKARESQTESTEFSFANFVVDLL